MTNSEKHSYLHDKLRFSEFEKEIDKEWNEWEALVASEHQKRNHQKRNQDTNPKKDFSPKKPVKTSLSDLISSIFIILIIILFFALGVLAPLWAVIQVFFEGHGKSGSGNVCEGLTGDEYQQCSNDPYYDRMREEPWR